MDGEQTTAASTLVRIHECDSIRHAVVHIFQSLQMRRQSAISDANWILYHVALKTSVDETTECDAAADLVEKVIE
jgi:hypothetical protein